jgi:hypothetical protein
VLVLQRQQNRPHNHQLALLQQVQVQVGDRLMSQVILLHHYLGQYSKDLPMVQLMVMVMVVVIEV